MTLSTSELRRKLSDIEPSESTYEGIGPTDVEQLKELLNDDEPWLAARAVYALSRVDSEYAQETLLNAVRNHRPEVRVAVAACAGRLPQEVSDRLLPQLLDDPEVGVRKYAIRSASPRNDDSIKTRIAEMAHTDTAAPLRGIAETKAEHLRGAPPEDAGDTTE